MEIIAAVIWAFGTIAAAWIRRPPRPPVDGQGAGKSGS